MLNGDIARKKTFHSFKFWLSPFGNYLNSLCYLKMNSKTLQKYHSPGTRVQQAVGDGKVHKGPGATLD